MAEYIERETTLDALRKAHNPNTARMAISFAAVNSVPAADVVPVVRGKWTSVFDIGTVCNQCGYDIEEHGFDVRTDGEPNFCPNCGADMRGEG